MITFLLIITQSELENNALFSANEILDMAVKLEKNGEAVYRDAIGKVAKPEFIALLESMADEEVKHADFFFNLKLENINNALLGLLNCLKTSPDLHPDNDVFWLAINHAAVKIIKLVDYNGKDAQTRLSQTIKSENFQKFVRQPVEKMSAERKQSLYNLNDFWNGLIP